jgi:hypothetical protein
MEMSEKLLNSHIKIRITKQNWVEKGSGSGKLEESRCEWVCHSVSECVTVCEPVREYVAVWVWDSVDVTVCDSVSVRLRGSVSVQLNVQPTVLVTVWVTVSDRMSDSVYACDSVCVCETLHVCDIECECVWVMQLKQYCRSSEMQHLLLSRVFLLQDFFPFQV